MDIVLAGILIALISGIAGNFIGSYHKVKECDCDRRQKDCQRLLIEMMKNLGIKIEGLTRVVNAKILGL